MSSMFYIPDEASLRRCQESQRGGAAISVSGVDVIDGTVKPYTGVVKTIEDAGPDAGSGRRWRIGMRDPD